MADVQICHVDPLDPEVAQDRMWQGYWAIWNAEVREVFGDDANQCDPQGERERVRSSPRLSRFAVALIDDMIIGIANLRISLPQEPARAFCDVRVRPGHQRQGVGTALADWVESLAVEHGATWCDASFAQRLDADAQQCAVAERSRRFAVARGCRVYQKVLTSELALPPGVSFTRAAHRPVPTGYAVETMVGVPRPELWHDLSVLQSRMSTDAPQGDRPAHAVAVDPAMIGEQVERAVALGEVVILAVARHEQSGRLVAYSVTSHDPHQSHVTHQGDTLVLREHRGQGLGRAIKVAAISRAIQLCPGARVHRTSNAEENVPMLRVNAELGYVAKQRFLNLMKDLI